MPWILLCTLIVHSLVMTSFVTFFFFSPFPAPLRGAILPKKYNAKFSHITDPAKLEIYLQVRRYSNK